MWKNFIVSADGTHHQLYGKPAYPQRFDNVLTFHKPGLAPVQLGLDAWHIHADGSAAYTRRFMRAFGFYEGLAAVESKDGWHHIRPDGTDAYTQRFAWCGNFQNQRCTVRDEDGLYCHIDDHGSSIYTTRWHYAGDYYGSIAAVQNEHGRLSHIDINGDLIHNRWFIDLDVFHKGYARARDDSGWTHIRPDGAAAYERRFAAVEPFYNGQARVECHDGSLEVIEEKGQTIQQLRLPLRSEFAALSGDMVGFWRTKTIATAVSLNLIEILPSSAETAAKRCDLDIDGARRLLRALGELNLTSCNNDIWEITDRGALLREDHPLSLKHAALEYAGPLSHKWEYLTDAISNTKGWLPPDIFSEVAQDTDRKITHHQMLQSYARHDYSLIPKAMKLNGNERIIDAAGGLGTLAKFLLDDYPDTSVTILERSEVVAQALKTKVKAQNNLHWQVGDLFDTWAIEADAVVLSRVLHDWSDSDAIRILKRARETVVAGGKLFVVEMVQERDSFGGSLCDLHLLMATGGKERSEDDFASLFESAGFSLIKTERINALPSVIVGVAI